MKPIDHETLKDGAQEIARPLVVHVVRQFLPNRGGLEDVVFNLCMQSIDRGLRVRVVTLDSLFSDPELRLAEREIIDGIEVVRIPWLGSSRYPLAHGAPLHIGDPAMIGIADVAKPDFGDPPILREGDVPVFWACGVTPQMAIRRARPDLAITHEPGCMLVTDLLADDAR